MRPAMEHRAHHDSLTGLPNRARFTALLDAALERTTAGLAAYNLMLLDLDRFKAVNDTLGHAAGDAVLVEVGRRIAPLPGARRRGGPAGGRRIRAAAARGRE